MSSTNSPSGQNLTPLAQLRGNPDAAAWEAVLNAEVKKIIDSNGTYPNYRYPSYIKEEHLEIIRRGWAKYNPKRTEDASTP